MTSRALERQITDFIGLVESQLARLIHTFHEATRKLPTPEKHLVLRDAFIVAWRRREHFDPLAEPVHVWFERCIRVAQYEGVQIEGDELAVLSKLSPEIDVQSFVATPPAAARLAAPSSDEGGVAAAAAPRGSDAIPKPGRDCPPCFLCMYHQGWLPRKTPMNLREGYVPQSEMDVVVQNLTRRKFEIANYVRGEYPEELLGD